MAGFGAKLPYFCPAVDEPDGAFPKYSGQPVRIGRLIKADLSVTLASGELDADDVVAESVSEFSSGSIAMETDDMVDEVAVVVYGATEEDGTVCYSVEDDPPKGGLTYMKKLMRNKKVLYKGYFYPLVKASLGNDTAQTKGRSINFSTTTTTFTIYACESGAWRFTHEAKTEAEVFEWMMGRFAADAQPPEEVDHVLNEEA